MGVKVLAVPEADALGESDFRFLFESASEARRERARRYLKREDACRSLVAEALVRHAFAMETGMAVNEASFRYNRFGKPEIPHTGLHFNITHSGEWVVCGIDSGEVGVDIERHHAADLAIAARFFCREENSLLAEARTASERIGQFFRIWALKESYVKAVGKGLSCDFEGFACLPDPDLRHAAFSSRDPALPTGHLHLLDVHPDYACAVCSLRQADAPTLVPIDFPSLAASILTGPCRTEHRRK